MQIFYLTISFSLLVGSAVGLAITVYAFARRKNPFILTVAGAMLCFLLGEVYWLVYESINGTTPQGFCIPDLSFIGYYFFLITGEFGIMSDTVKKELGKPPRYRWALAAPGTVAIFAFVLIQLGRDAVVTLAYLLPMAVYAAFALQNLLIAKRSPTLARLKWYNLCGLLFVAFVEVSYFFDAFHNPIGNGIPMLGVAAVLAAQALTALKGVREA